MMQKKKAKNISLTGQILLYELDLNHLSVSTACIYLPAAHIAERANTIPVSVLEPPRGLSTSFWKADFTAYTMAGVPSSQICWALVDRTRLDAVQSSEKIQKPLWESDRWGLLRLRFFFYLLYNLE